MPLRLLVVASETPEQRDARRRHVGEGSHETYASTLRALDGACEITHVSCVDGDNHLSVEDLAGFDGIFFAGSPIQMQDETPETRAAASFMGDVFASGMPSFGSCAGLQIAAVAAGGTCKTRESGLEAGFARGIVATEAGRRHPLLEGRPLSWSAPALHFSRVDRLPDGATVLAQADGTPVEAAEIRFGNGMFWGVQYHPEITVAEMPPHSSASLSIWLRKGWRQTRATLPAMPPSSKRSMRNPPAAIGLGSLDSTMKCWMPNGARGKYGTSCATSVNGLSLAARHREQPQRRLHPTTCRKRLPHRCMNVVSGAGSLCDFDQELSPSINVALRHPVRVLDASICFSTSPRRSSLGSLMEGWSPAIAIPARNEEDRLPSLLAALDRQSWTSRGSRLPVTVVMNNCTDRTIETAQSMAGHCSNLILDLLVVEYAEAEAHVGSARRQAMDRALASINGSPDQAAVLTTDADAVPASDWVDANLAALRKGADLIGGLIVGDVEEEAVLGESFQHRAALQARYAELADHLTSLIDPLPFDPWPRHHDHTGASLCVRGDVYRTVGGLPCLPFREDLTFVSRARAMGFRVRHDPAVRVGVSARLDGRAPGGMADTLKAWLAEADQDVPQLAEAPGEVVRRARLRAALRNLDSSGQFNGVDADLDFGLLAAARRSGLKGIALVETFVPDEPDAAGTMPIGAAIAQLRTMIAAKGRELAQA